MDEHGRKRPRVLVVDDDEGVRSFLVRGLRREGLEAVEAADGQAGLDGFEKRTPELVLLDVQMPKLSGFEVCEAIRGRESGHDVPVVMMTGMDDASAIQRAYDVGATDFITKPINWLILSHRLRYLLRAGSNLQALRRSQERLANAQRLALMGSWQIDFDDGSFSGSEALWEILGVEPQEEPSIQTLAQRIHPDDRGPMLDAYRRCRDGGEPSSVDHRVVRPDGSERILRCQIRMLMDAKGAAAGLEGTLQDMTERKRTEEQVRFLSSHDPLTSLGNRRLFQERLALAIRHARTGDRKVGVLYLDVDHFKRINETFGHSVGDSLLSEVANRLVMSVRGADLVARSDPAWAEQQTAVSRFGGDEFTILIPQLHDEQALAAVARRLLDGLSQPFSLQGHEVVVGGSVGIAVFPSDGNNPEELLRNANSAMYAAKERGRGDYQFYAQSMNELSLRRLILEGKLRKALDASHFELFFQPKLSLESGAITGFEGLLRWDDPELGMVGPCDFIPVAEETGMISRLGAWVIRRACRQVAAWDQNGTCQGSVAVNLSPEQFRQPGLADRILREASEADIDPRRLEFEITESVVLRDTEEVIQQLQAIRAHGMRVALDDFGTGYSSLSYLRKLPVDILKIDRSFIQHIEDKAEDAALTGGIIAMGKALGLRIVAEGAETEGQRDLLTEWQCDEMQGFLFSPAVRAHEAEALWRQGRPARKPGPPGS